MLLIQKKKYIDHFDNQKHSLRKSVVKELKEIN